MKRLILLCFLISGFLAHSQVFAPLAQGLPQKASMSASDNSSVYYGYRLGNPVQTHIHKWNGFSWSALPLFNGYSTDLFVFQGNIYLVALNLSAPYGSSIYKMENGSWQQKGQSFQGYVTDIEQMNNQVILAGAINDASLGAIGLISFDGTSVSAIYPAKQTDSIQAIAYIQNQLWAVGVFSSQVGTDTSSVMKYNVQNSEWEYPATKKSGLNYSYFLREIFELNGKVYAVRQYGSDLYEVRNDSLILLANANLPYTTADIVVHNNIAYIGGPAFSTFDGIGVTQISPWPANSYLLNLVGNDLFISTHTAQFAGVNLNYVFKLGLNNLALVQGTIYDDKNANCSYDAGEPSGISAGYTYSLGGNTIFIGATGSYSLLLPAGTYAINNLHTINQIDQYLQHRSSCSGQSSITVQGGQNYIHDIPFEHDGTMDRAIELSSFSSGRLRQGFDENLLLEVYNPGGDFSGNVDIEIDLAPNLTYVGSSPYFTGQSNGTLSFQLNGIDERERFNIPVLINVGLGTTINDTLCINSRIVANSNDANPMNDTSNICLRVSAAHDPNDKRANLEASLPGLSELDYHIRFQNTGTDTAYKVVVVDTLESYFDPSSISLGSCSHPYTFRVEDENILVWTFDDIRLPDSTTNNPASQGFIKFKIDVDSSLPIGSVIDNDAEIYFDYQPPVHTNHAQTFIVDELSITENAEAPNFRLYPNPFRDQLIVETKAANESLVLYNLQGEKLREFKFEEAAKYELKLDELEAGVYLMKGSHSSYKIIKH